MYKRINILKIKNKAALAALFLSAANRFNRAH